MGRSGLLWKRHPWSPRAQRCPWSDKEWLEDVDMKTIGMLRITQAFRPHMARDGSGRIINISGAAMTFSVTYRGIPQVKDMANFL